MREKEFAEIERIVSLPAFNDDAVLKKVMKKILTTNLKVKNE
jgi:hypothetical protein